MRLAPSPSSSASSQHRLVAELPLSVRAVVAALVGLAALPSVHAAALPRVQPLAKGECRPVLSGLVQEIQSAVEPNIVWKAVTSEATAQDGVKAVKVPRRRAAPLPLEFEWFVEQTDEPGVYSISASSSVSACSELLSSGSLNPFTPNPQRAFSPGDAVAAATACSPAHLFRLSCTSCDAHEDSAQGCTMQSVSNGSCVELLPAMDDGGRPHLGWGECVTERELSQKGWKGKEARDERRRRQLWDIVPS
ncbi:hypothetical protein JCM9279_001766 [Rhodotorula babjevae]